MARQKDNTEQLRKQWILEDYKSIIEDVEAFGYESLKGHMEEVVDVIQEDIEDVFSCRIDRLPITKEIEEYEKTRFI